MTSLEKHVITVRLLLGVDPPTATVMVQRAVEDALAHRIDPLTWLDGWTALIATLGCHDAAPLAACAVFSRTFRVPFVRAVVAVQELACGEFEWARSVGISVEAIGDELRLGLGAVSVTAPRTGEGIVDAWVRLAASIGERRAQA